MDLRSVPWAVTVILATDTIAFVGVILRTAFGGLVPLDMATMWPLLVLPYGFAAAGLVLLPPAIWGLQHGRAWGLWLHLPVAALVIGAGSWVPGWAASPTAAAISSIWMFVLAGLVFTRGPKRWAGLEMATAGSRLG